jgi:Holliday junction resolvase RusA-like endonuclease
MAETTEPRFTEVVFPFAPVPASRPRVGRWGTYYAKKYSSWRKEAEEVMASLPAMDPVMSGAVGVILRIAVPRPKTTARVYPDGDVDNYEKAIYDAITGAPKSKNLKVWKDDDQIVWSLPVKFYSPVSETRLVIYELGEQLPGPCSVLEVRIDGRSWGL